MSDSGRRMLEEAPETLRQRIRYAEGLPEAVAIAKDITEKGKICLLSPAAASYNVYQNFEKRGDHFRELSEK